MSAFERTQHQAQNRSAVNFARPARSAERSALRSNPLLARQQAYGNQTAQRMLNTKMIRAKLTVSQPGDQYEQEADRVADQVMRMPNAETINAPAETGQGIHIQRMCSDCEDEVQRQPMEEEKEEEKVQTKQVAGHTPELTSDAQAQVSAVRGGGQPLPESARSFFEPRFGHDFSHVRIHTGTQAAESARAVHSLAYTVGRDVVFGAGQYDPNHFEGRRLLAHELVHTVQQGGFRQIQRQANPAQQTKNKPVTKKKYGDYTIKYSDLDLMVSYKNPITSVIETKKLRDTFYGIWLAQTYKPKDFGVMTIVLPLGTYIFFSLESWNKSTPEEKAEYFDRFSLDFYVQYDEGIRKVFEKQVQQAKAQGKKVCYWCEGILYHPETGEPMNDPKVNPLYDRNERGYH